MSRGGALCVWTVVALRATDSEPGDCSRPESFERVLYFEKFRKFDFWMSEWNNLQ